MKYSVKLLLALLFAILLTACGGGDKDDKEKDGAAEKSKETLTIGTNAAFPPFENLEKGEVVGFDIDLIKAIMEEANIEGEVVHSGWEQLFHSLKNGDIDLAISAITITDERKQTYDFSDPYFEAAQMILVPEGSQVASFEDLKELKVGVQTGTTGDFKVGELIGDKNENLRKYETVPLAIMALNNGEVDAVVADHAVISNYIINNPDTGIVSISDADSFEPEFYGIAFQQGNNELREKINTALLTIIENGTYSEIYQSWFGEEPDTDLLREQL